MVIDSSNVLVRSEGQLAAVIGLKDVVVVATGDAVLVADRSQTAKVKKLVESLKAQGHPEATEHRRNYRPWGYYQSIDQGPRYQVKRIVVRPGGRLSLQKHHHRAEHWVVVRGAAEVTLNEQSRRSYTRTNSIYLPIGSTHRLANPGKIDVELIEVQTGSYLERMISSGSTTSITVNEVMAAPSAGAAIEVLVLLLRSQARDLVNVGAVDADVVQLAIGISRKLLQDVPIYATCAQEA